MALRVKEHPLRVPVFDSRKVKPHRVIRGVRQPGPFDGLYKSRRWKALMREIIQLRGRVCEDPTCQTPGYGRGGILYGDHIHELKDGGDPFDFFRLYDKSKSTAQPQFGMEVA